MDSNNLYDYAPHLRKEWNEEKNGPMRNYSRGSRKKVWWKCSKVPHHEWYARIDNRTGVDPRNCPICSNQLICPRDQCNSLYKSEKFQEIKNEWNEEKNGSAKDYTQSSHKKVWWMCSKVPHHEWYARIDNRTRVNSRNCPICSNQLICPKDKCNSLYGSKQFEEIENEWNEEKNGSAKNYFPMSDKKVWWKCGKIPHHEWKARIGNRTGSNPLNCPICSNQLICPKDQCNSLYISEKFQEIKNEWNEKKNGSAKNYFPMSGKKVWWICNKVPHHEWKTSIHHRTGYNSSSCPMCNMSHLEKEFEYVSTVLQLNPIFEAKFENCKNITHLPFDVHLKDHNILVELDGKQHFIRNDYFYATFDEFINRILTDIKKNVFAFSIGKSLLRIPYTCEGHIERILSKFLATCNNICIHRYYLHPYAYLEFRKYNNVASPVFKISKEEYDDKSLEDIYTLTHDYIKKYINIDNIREILKK